MKCQAKSFLSLVADKLHATSNGDLAKACVVFPTRRAALLFRTVLADQIKRPVIAPEILSITDFIDFLSPVKPLDNLSLIFHLYKSYKSQFPEESFDQFFYWGEMMLRDFNDISLQCINSDKLFASMRNLGEIDEMFGFTENEQEEIKRLWSKFSMKEPGVIETSFFKTWHKLPMVYNHFLDYAGKNKIVWEGKAYHEIISGLKNGTIQINREFVYFCGFYHITKIHQELAEELKRHVTVEFLYDADEYYVKDDAHEAGEVFRNLLVSRKFDFITANLKSLKRKITITGCPMREMQAKTAGLVLKEIYNPAEGSRVAVVLPDEKMLLPVLNSLPDQIDIFNVTMGFPVNYSLTGDFIASLCDLHQGCQGNPLRFFSPNLIKLLNHPVLPPNLRLEARQLIKKINIRQILWVQEGDLPARLGEFLMIRQGNSITDYVLNILSVLADKSVVVSELEKSIAAFVNKSLAAYKSLLHLVSNEMSTVTEWKIILKIISWLRIPFSGEPIAGLQIMGLLETRSLDFDKVVILCANEGTLPSSSFQQSFIPYIIRRGFGMSLPADRDSVTAYHFYRLLQRASDIHIFYDTEGSDFSEGEMSRFILQLLYEVSSKTDNNTEIVHKIVTARLAETDEQPIVISKTSGMLAEFREKLRVSKQGLSASALSSYINCKLQFYFRYIAHIRELDEISEIPGPDVFGKLLHEAIKNLYDGQAGMSESSFNDIERGMEPAVSQAEKKIYNDSQETKSGFYMLNHQIILKLIKKVLQLDKQRVPFEILGLEVEVKANLRTGFPVSGIIDRIQKKSGIIEILDYKTGQAETTSDMKKLFSDPKYKASFQLFFYNLLVKTKDPVAQTKAGLYMMRELQEGIAFLNEGEALSQQIADEFEQNLNLLIEEIFNVELPFTQTEDRKRCEYCPYKDICKR